MRELRLLVCSVLAASLLTASPAWPVTVELPQSVRDAMPELRLRGDGRLRWFGLHVYDISLWSTGGQINFQRPFVLAIRYARDFEGRRIALRSVEEIKQLGYGAPDQLETWRQAMERVFPDVKAGQRLTGVYRPGAGVDFYYGELARGTIADVEFAHAFFSIWLDPRTREPSLRERLLGKI
jgi:hypothetical protein